jgi:hypothetical protein
MKNPSTRRLHKLAIALSCSLTALSAQAAGFNSGSTGLDGVLSPTASTTITLPASGIFNYTTVNIPAGVTVKFVRNPAGPSLPAILLATGDVTIAGIIDVSGGDSLPINTGTVGDRSAPGIGGPGGFNGGRGGLAESNRVAGAGLGPGAGGGGGLTASGNPVGGTGGSYGTLGTLSGVSTTAGPVYGSNLLTPLIGGSGGGGGAGAPAVNGYSGNGGGGGGGAILIASSTTVTLTGSILAKGGIPGIIDTTGFAYNGSQNPATGGCGSGGAIRIVAANFAGSGTMDVSAGVSPNPGSGNGGLGRTRVEIATTGTLSLGGVPTLTITSVAGVAAPASPTGTGDVSVPVSAANPATVAFSASGVPLGNTIALTLTPLRGTTSTATSTALAGTVGSSTATASINIPQGISTLTASGSYTITVAMGEMLRQYAGDERVAKVALTATYGGASTAKLITVSGKEYEVPAEVLRMVALDG